MANMLLSNGNWVPKSKFTGGGRGGNSHLQYPHKQHHNNISLGMRDALLSPNPQEISTTLTVVNADFCTHRCSTCITEIPVLGNHVQPINQKEENRGET